MYKLQENSLLKRQKGEQQDGGKMTEEWTERQTEGQRDPNKPRKTFQP